MLYPTAATPTTIPVAKMRPAEACTSVGWDEAFLAALLENNRRLMAALETPRRCMLAKARERESMKRRAEESSDSDMLSPDVNIDVDMDENGPGY